MWSGQGPRVDRYENSHELWLVYGWNEGAAAAILQKDDRLSMVILIKDRGLNRHGPIADHAATMVNG